MVEINTRTLCDKRQRFLMLEQMVQTVTTSLYQVTVQLATLVIIS